MRVVVYAEGAAELVGEWASWPSPGSSLLPEHKGPAHVLVARSLELVRGLPVAAIRFEKGLRKRNATEPRGSDLLDKRTLLRLLDWPLHDMRPDLAVVLVDEDGRKARYKDLREWIETLRHGRPPTVVAVAKQEFESWLITDRVCLQSVLGRSFEPGGDPEAWEPREAKRTLEAAIEAAGDSSTAGRLALRREICLRCDLQRLRASRSFQRFLDDLR